MTEQKHNLISIANPKLAEALSNSSQAPNEQRGNEHSIDTLILQHGRVQQQVWRAVFTLNIIRYLIALCLLTTLVFAPQVIVTKQNELLIGCTLIILCSAIAFSYASKKQHGTLTLVLSLQFLIDLVVATVLISIIETNNQAFFFVYFLIVSTGSVVLSRRKAIGLASAAIGLMIANAWIGRTFLTDRPPADVGVIASNAAILIGIAFFISFVAQQLSKRQLSQYVPGTESLESYLMREEINAIQNALQQTQGNKTQAAALLGLTFRSFRYKLVKYKLD